MLGHTKRTHCFHWVHNQKITAIYGFQQHTFSMHTYRIFTNPWEIIIEITKTPLWRHTSWFHLYCLTLTLDRQLVSSHHLCDSRPRWWWSICLWCGGLSGGLSGGRRAMCPPRGVKGVLVGFAASDHDVHVRLTQATTPHLRQDSRR